MPLEDRDYYREDRARRAQLPHPTGTPERRRRWTRWIPDLIRLVVLLSMLALFFWLCSRVGG